MSNGLTLPFAGSISSTQDAFSITNTSPGGIAVSGSSDGGMGVTGNGGLAGVFGGSNTGDGVRGQSDIGIGVRGDSENNSGVHGQTINGVGVSGQGRVGVSGSGNTGVEGRSTNGEGVHGETSSPTFAAVAGVNKDGGTGVAGISDGGNGIHGINGKGASTKPNVGSGVWGESENGNGVSGISTANDGVVGITDGQGKTGVLGIANVSTGHGVHGINGVGAQAKPDRGTGVWGESEDGVGVVGVCEKNIGVFGQGGLRAGFFQGDVEVTGDIFLRNADCAEDFDISGTEKIEPGTVMVLDQDGALKQSQQAYDKKVAGVISGAGNFKPGITLDKRHSLENRLPIALLGKAYCKVDAQYSSVEVGDLLTTSPTLGHAMKATDPLKAFGAVIGKALRPLKEGQGLVPVLIALQ